jgi:hypothetical protein
VLSLILVGAFMISLAVSRAHQERIMAVHARALADFEHQRAIQAAQQAVAAPNKSVAAPKGAK